MEKYFFSQAGREARDFIERELRQTLLTPLAKSPHNSGVKVHILPFSPHTLISQQSEMTFSLSIERLIEPSTGPKDLIKAIFHLGKKVNAKHTSAAKQSSLPLFHQSSCSFPASPHQFSLCCFLSVLHAILMFVVIFACVLLMISTEFLTISKCGILWQGVKGSGMALGMAAEVHQRGLGLEKIRS